MFAPRLDESEQKLMRGVGERFGVKIKRVRLVGLVCVITVLAGSLSGFPNIALLAQDSGGKKFSPEVVAKAAKILEEIGLKRNGKTIAATNTAEISRAISGLAREKRQLKLVHKDWKLASEQALAIRNQIKQLQMRDVELNMQLAKVAGNASANNQLVALINAGRGKSKLLVSESEKARERVSAKRSTLSDAEAAYADTVLAIRKDFNIVSGKLSEFIKEDKAKIAFRVMHLNFDTPSPIELTAARILSTLSKRIERLEQEVFSESIPLEVHSNGGLYVNVVVGTKTVSMVVDSGASVICLTSKVAAELGVTVPRDARELKLVMADGREIPARAVTLPRVRVGEFEAESIRAAVLDPSADNAEPLLGMSYLGNFKFEIDSNQKSLTMLRVVTD